VAESNRSELDTPVEQQPLVTPSEADDGLSEVSKRDKRRQREAKKKAAEEAELAARKEARKASKKSSVHQDTLAEQNDKLRKDDGRARNDADFTTHRMKKGKGKQQHRPQQLPDEFSDEKVERAVQAVRLHQSKMLDKWGNAWDGE
jgi:hypothetical protein